MAKDLTTSEIYESEHVIDMEKNKTIHLEKPNTLSKFLSEREQQEVVSLKITGIIGRKDFDDVLDGMCELEGEYDDDDNFIPDYEYTAAIRHLDLGEATYVDGDVLPYFGYNTQLETLILPQGIISTCYEYETGFSESDDLQKLILPKGLKIVKGFQNCHNLTGLTLPEGIEEICSFAFAGCSAISSIYIPASVKTFDGSCFADCNIAAFEMDDRNPYYTVVDGVVYSKDLTTLVAFPSAYQHKHFIVPDTTKVVGFSAFMDSHIESIKLPEGLSVIKGSAFQGSTIRSIEIPNTVTEVGELAFRECLELEHVRLSDKLSVLPRQLFSSCPNLKDLDVPPSVKSICYSAIAWSYGLEHLHLHDGLEEIVDEGPMLGCGGHLREICFPKTLKKVPGGVFNYSPHIKTYQLDPANPYFSVLNESLCSKDGKTLFSVPCPNRTSYIIPEGVEVIAERAFAFLPKLYEVFLPSTLKAIGERAFQDCDSLRRIQIPASVAKVHIDALWADKLKTVVMDSPIPPKVTGQVKDDDWGYQDVELYVPNGAKSAYKNAPGWKCFMVKEMKDC